MTTTTYTVQPASKPLAGQVRVPGDKSITHRALIFGSLARGPARITGVGAGLDNQSSARAMTAMGVTLTPEPGTRRRPDAVIVHGRGLRGLRGPHRELDCGNSGTTMRLLAGLLVAQNFSSRLVGDSSLEKRPMMRVVQPLARMGGTITGRLVVPPGELYPPLYVQPARGSLSGILYKQPVASAQVKSAILAAALYADGVTRVCEPAPSRDHTERLLLRMGAPIQVMSGGVIEVDTRGWDQHLSMPDLHIPGDPSHAAFIIAAGLLAGVDRVTVRGVGINHRRTGFLDVLTDMGALIEREAMVIDEWEATADLALGRGAGDGLVGTVIEGATTVRAIDELPILAVVAARAAGETIIRNASELRVKESDRISATCDMLRILGVDAYENRDGLVIQGDPDRPFRSARIHARGDHRIAMCAAVAALAAEGPIRVVGAETVATSFPEFVDVMRSLGADIAVH